MRDVIWPLVLIVSLATPVAAQVGFFGYVGVMCDHDDPFDDSGLTDYRAEVAGFTNANHVCLPADPTAWADRIRTADAAFRPILSIEGAFDFEGAGPDGASGQATWPFILQAIRDSGVDPGRLILHLVDEPTLRGIRMDWVSLAAARVRADLPQAEVMVIEACRIEGPPPIPPEVTLWGFDCYTIPDPGAEPYFMAFLNAALWSLHDGQRLVLIMDANHTPIHAANGLAPDAMADVARAYAALALATPQVAGVIGYTWPGGVDNLDERGVRDLPPAVIAAHKEVGRLLLGLAP